MTSKPLKPAVLLKKKESRDQSIDTSKQQVKCFTDKKLHKTISKTSEVLKQAEQKPKESAIMVRAAQLYQKAQMVLCICMSIIRNKPLVPIVRFKYYLDEQTILVPTGMVSLNQLGELLKNDGLYLLAFIILQATLNSKLDHNAPDYFANRLKHSYRAPAEPVDLLSKQQQQFRDKLLIYLYSHSLVNKQLYRKYLVPALLRMEHKLPQSFVDNIMMDQPDNQFSGRGLHIIAEESNSQCVDRRQKQPTQPIVLAQKLTPTKRATKSKHNKSKSKLRLHTQDSRLTKNSKQEWSYRQQVQLLRLFAKYGRNLQLLLQQFGHTRTSNSIIYRLHRLLNTAEVKFKQVYSQYQRVNLLLINYEAHPHPNSIHIIETPQIPTCPTV